MEKVSDAIVKLLLKEPFLGYMVKRIKIMIDENNDCFGYTDGRKIFLCHKLIEKNNINDIAFVLAHEILHLILRHNDRIRELRRRYGQAMVLNVLADAIVNAKITNLQTSIDKIDCRRLGEILYDNRVVDICESKSLEELAEYVFKKSNYMKLVNMMFGYDIIDREGDNGGGSDGGGDDGDKDDGEGGNRDGSEMINGDGDMGVLQDGMEIDDDVQANNLLIETAILAKMAGVIPGWVERLIDELLKPKISWRNLLRQYLNMGKIRRSWSRMNRKNPLIAGKMWIGNKATILVDVSGSITDKELHDFISEVLALMRDAEIEVVFWDVGIRGIYRIRTKKDLWKLKIMGGGGTKIKEALEYAIGRSGMIIIMSDWNIFDLTDVDDILRKNRDRIIAVTTNMMPPKYLKTIKLRER
ncbi:MAG: VWA-like domain-containing protein [Thermofilaceae archaeon]